MVEATDPRRPVSPPGTLSRCLSGVGHAVKWLVISLVFSIVIEWVGMIFWWPDEGAAHSRDMLVRELQYLSVDVRHSVLVSDPVRFVAEASQVVSYYAFEWTGFLDLLQWLAPPPAVEEQGLRPLLHRLYSPLAEFVLATIHVTQVFAARLAVLTLATPVFGLFAAVALVDGLVRRDLRRWGGGRESSFIYHYAKKSTMPLITTAWVVYLALPFSIHPSWIILPFALAFALAITVTASTFKKYL